MLLLVLLQQIRALEIRAAEHSLCLLCRFVLRVSLVLYLQLQLAVQNFVGIMLAFAEDGSTGHPFCLLLWAPVPFHQV